MKSKLTKDEYINWIPGVWDIQVIPKIKGHPCIWPDELPRRLIKMFSFVGDTVLDPWLGSGTTVKVAKTLGREGVGYEKNPEYKALIMKQLGMQTMAEYAKEKLQETGTAEEQKTPPVCVMCSPGMEKEIERILGKDTKTKEAA